MWLDCPRAVTEPPTCDGDGSLRFEVTGPDYSVNVGPEPLLVEQKCSCVLTDEEYDALVDIAIERYHEGPSEP